MADFPLPDFETLSYCQKCHDYFAMGSEPFVPTDQTRKLMRVLAECQSSARRSGEE